MANADPVEDPNWKFNNKSPMPDNLLLAGIHNLLSKNSFKAMGEQKHKGITNPDFDRAFLGKAEGEDENVAELFEELGEMEFEKPDLREMQRNLGRD